MQPLGERRVAYDAIPQCGVRQVTHHCHLDDGHNLTSFDAENGCPENLIGPRIDHYLHHTPRLADIHRAKNLSHRQGGDSSPAQTADRFLKTRCSLCSIDWAVVMSQLISARPRRCSAAPC